MMTPSLLSLMGLITAKEPEPQIKQTNIILTSMIIGFWIVVQLLIIQTWMWKTGIQMILIPLFYDLTLFY